MGEQKSAGTVKQYKSPYSIKSVKAKKQKSENTTKAKVAAYPV